jgi:phosphatidylglycerophosphate synthase
MPASFIKAVPNALSSMRLMLALAFPFVPAEWRLPALIVGALSDWIDGVIARRYEATTSSGVLLDAIADKIFTLSVLVTIAMSGQIEWWQIALALARDITVAGVAGWCALVLKRPDAIGHMRPRLPGKATTTLVFFWLIALLAGVPAEATLTLFIAAALCSMVAAIDYLRVFLVKLPAAA